GKFAQADSWYQGFNEFAGVADSENRYWTELLAVRDQVNRALEQARRDDVIGGSLQAELTLYAQPELADKLQRLDDELRFVMLTSAAHVSAVDKAPAEAVATDINGLWLQVKRTEYAKC